MSDTRTKDKDCAAVHTGDREGGGLADQVRSLIALLKRHQAHLDALQADIESGDLIKRRAAGKVETMRAEPTTAPSVAVHREESPSAVLVDGKRHQRSLA